jgi:hypothetical protein
LNAPLAQRLTQILVHLVVFQSRLTNYLSSTPADPVR